MLPLILRIKGATSKDNSVRPSVRWNSAFRFSLSLPLSHFLSRPLNSMLTASSPLSPLSLFLSHTMGPYNKLLVEFHHSSYGNKTFTDKLIDMEQVEKKKER